MNNSITFRCGELTLALYPRLETWRVETSCEPDIIQYDDFPSRAEALAFLKAAIMTELEAS